VYQRFAVLPTQSSPMLKTATDVINAQLVMNQMLIDLNVSELDQLAVALKFMTLLVITVSHAQLTKLLQITTVSVSQDNAQVQIKFSELLILAMHAELVSQDLLQIT
jgi:hypothetical protein